MIFFGLGSPNTKVTAPASALYLQEDGAVGEQLWQKQSGSGNTGWTLFPSQAVFNLAAYGAAGDGVTDDTAAIQAAYDAAAATPNVGDVLWPPGTYKFNTINILTASQSTNIFGNVRTIFGPDVVLRPQTAPMFLIGNTSNGTDGFWMEGPARVELSKDLGLKEGLIHMRLVRFFEISDITLWGGNTQASPFNYGAFLFDLDASYLGTIRRCDARVRYGYLYEIRGDVRATEQRDTIVFDNCSSIAMAVGVHRSVTADLHNVHVVNPKHVLTTFAETNASVETTLATSPSAGATSFDLASAAGLAVGSAIWLGVGNSIELVKIGGLAGVTVTVDSTLHPTGLRFAHTSGDLVLSGGVGFSLGTANYTLIVDTPHFEFGAAGVYLGGAQAVVLRDVWSSHRDVVRMVANASRMLKISGAQQGGNSGTANVLRVTAAGDTAASNVEWNSDQVILESPFNNPNTGNLPTLYTHDAALVRSYTLVGQERKTNRRGSTGTLTPDLWQARNWELEGNGSGTTVTVNLPTHLVPGQSFSIQLWNSTGGAVTWVFDAGYNLKSAVNSPAAGKRQIYTFYTNGTTIAETTRSNEF